MMRNWEIEESKKEEKTQGQETTEEQSRKNKNWSLGKNST